MMPLIYILYFIFIGLGILFIILLQFVPCHTLGIPLFSRNVRWVLFIALNKKKFTVIDNYHFYFKGKIIIFLESWLFHVYEGESVEEVKYKYDLGGQSNKADYLTWWEKLIGKNIENWYLSNIENRFRGKEDKI